MCYWTATCPAPRGRGEQNSEDRAGWTAAPGREPGKGSETRLTRSGRCLQVLGPEASRQRQEAGHRAGPPEPVWPSAGPGGGGAAQRGPGAVSRPARPAWAGSSLSTRPTGCQPRFPHGSTLGAPTPTQTGPPTGPQKSEEKLEGAGLAQAFHMLVIRARIFFTYFLN